MLDYHFILLFLFILGYGFIIFEHNIKINKSGVAILTGVILWMIFLQFDPDTPSNKFAKLYIQLSDITQILLFLIGAMTIVELIVTHEGFEVIKQSMLISSPRKLFWVLALIGFWLSSVLDNLTTILILVSLIKQTVDDAPMRRVLAAGLVFVVNVGGAWTPIGDITTTMLWINGKVNTLPLIASLGIPSLISLGIFNTLYMFSIPEKRINLFPRKKANLPARSKQVLYLGVAGFITVPIMKLVFDLPPFMGMLLSLGVIWVITDCFHKKYEDRKELIVENILTKIDISCVLFFLGILLAIGCLEAAGILDWIAIQSEQLISNPYFFSMMIGLLSALIDNVPLVAGIMKMFDSSVYPPDHVFWFLNAYCAGVGGSLLIIGSAPGVALMSLKDIPFFWYVKRVSGIVLISYLAGWGSIYLLEKLF